MYNFVNPEYFKNDPENALDHASDSLFALKSLILLAGDSELEDRACIGIANLMTIIGDVIDAANKDVGLMIGSPHRAGLREGMAVADQRYLEGVKSGHATGYGKAMAMIDDVAKGASKRIENIAKAEDKEIIAEAIQMALTDAERPTDDSGEDMTSLESACAEMGKLDNEPSTSGETETADADSYPKIDTEEPTSATEKEPSGKKPKGKTKAA